MRWKPHVRFGGRAGETHPPKGGQGAPVRSHHAGSKLDECRRRVQNETMGHRGRKDDPLYRARRLLTKAHEDLDERGGTKLMGLLEAGDPRGEVRMTWHMLLCQGRRVDHAAGRCVDRRSRSLRRRVTTSSEIRRLSGRMALRLVSPRSMRAWT